MPNIVTQHQEEINKICQNSGIIYLGIFGSQARDDAGENSDVDLLVEYHDSPGLIGFIRTKQQFEKLFNRKVDLVTKNGMSKYLSPYIEQDIKKIYG